ncbi:MAG: hypothetical protein OXG35_17165 [Acidobacteria bacterium]|nr:hypothetical protein [Acidobacteriota bacterium]
MGEMDMEGHVWTIPAERMKMKREHRVTLTRRALDLLEAARTLDRRRQPFVFPSIGTKRLHDMARSGLCYTRGMLAGGAAPSTSGRRYGRTVPVQTRPSPRHRAAGPDTMPTPAAWSSQWPARLPACGCYHSARGWLPGGDYCP